MADLNPLVSVIIPCFRQAHFLSSAINSALSQSYSSLEVIVINDGSDDDTEAVAGRFAGRITYIHKQNGGLPSARNAGIKVAVGSYLMFLDSDDLLHPDAIHWLVGAAEGRKDRLCVMGLRVFADENKIENEPDEFIDHLLPALPTFIHRNIAPPHAYLSPREAVIEAGLFDEKLKSCEDWDLWLRLSLAGAEVVSVRKAGAFYRRYAGSMSCNLPRMLHARAQVLLKAHKIILADERLRSQWGKELFLAEAGAYRRCLIQQADTNILKALEDALWEVRHAHIARHSWPRNLGSRIIGYRAWERLSTSYMKFTDPTKYSRYASQYD